MACYIFVFKHIYSRPLGVSHDITLQASKLSGKYPEARSKGWNEHLADAIWRMKETNILSHTDTLERVEVGAGDMERGNN